MRRHIPIATILFAISMVGYVAPAAADHTWSCPEEVQAFGTGDFDFEVLLFVGEGGAAHETFQVTVEDNVRDGLGWDNNCTNPLGQGQTLKLRVIGQLADSRLEGRLRVRLTVCSNGPGPTEWESLVTIVPHPQPHVWIVPEVVVADDLGEFSFQATLLVGEGGAGHDYGGYQGLENTDALVVADGFCFEMTPEGGEIRTWVDGHLVDPHRPGWLEVWLGVCAPTGQYAQGYWSSEVLIAPSDVATEEVSFSTLKSRFR